MLDFQFFVLVLLNSLLLNSALDTSDLWKVMNVSCVLHPRHLRLMNASAFGTSADLWKVLILPAFCTLDGVRRAVPRGRGAGVL